MFSVSDTSPMTSLYNYIRARNPDGLVYEDAVQLFLWIYCTPDVLPPALRIERFAREDLVDTFGRLTYADVILFPPPLSKVTSMSDSHSRWNKILDEFLLSKRPSLDPDFPNRLGEIL